MKELSYEEMQEKINFGRECAIFQNELNEFIEGKGTDRVIVAVLTRKICEIASMQPNEEKSYNQIIHVIEVIREEIRKEKTYERK